ncbi:MAG TPA: chorismate lyase [Gammaproteobacteria bacterium]|nr:chorismate lyase [Gammaproteobacteria bacterium]
MPEFAARGGTGDTRRKPAGARRGGFRPPTRPPGQRPPEALRAWLEDPGSVTARMRVTCGAEFSLLLVAQHKARPLLAEARELKLPPRRFALIRQVLLCCADVPWIFARSVLPFSTLRGRKRRLAYLGSKPLGEVLFALPGLVRHEVSVVPLCADPAMQEALIDALGEDPDGAWLRRSVFLLDNDPLLINEVFLSNIPYG